jgi:tRNA pseudouridine55 synthase
MNETARGDGIVLVSKPVGITSHDMVERVRRLPVSGGFKVGHAGTLDPFATGLLVMLIGRATRIQQYVIALSKTYRATARFGMTSTTGDPTGALTSTGESATFEDLKATLPLLTGDIRQQVPLTSAVKVAGERLYRKAHRGEEFETPVRTVHVSRLELVAFDESEQTGEFELECSSGTYVRQLVTDLGRLIGKGAYCETLERSAIGPFKLEDVDDRRLIPLADALDFLPERRLAPDEARVARHGIAVALAEYGEEASGTVVRLTSEGELIALAERRENVLKPMTVLSS